MKKIYLTNLQKENGHQYYVRVRPEDLKLLVDHVNGYNADHPDGPYITTINEMMQGIVHVWCDKMRKHLEEE